MDIEQIFSGIGGTFLSSREEMEKAVLNTKAFIFDWDGVFNNGMKNGDAGSPFSEVDSMGINLMRFSFWLRTGTIPYCYIITGMTNQTAISFAKREHFDGIVMNLKKKKLALDAICRIRAISPREVAFVYDDVIDLETAKETGLSFYVSRSSNPLLNSFVKDNAICDYITASPGGNHALREITELVTGLSGNYRQTMESRIVFSKDYEEYLKAREKIITDSDISL
ncbi:MAG TPA: hypothetical protein VMT63_02520 [Bacteroidales bacterium]|nr:hypothetical protein [Bacteroidales bacterium]